MVLLLGFDQPAVAGFLRRAGCIALIVTSVVSTSCRQPVDSVAREFGPARSFSVEGGSRVWRHSKHRGEVFADHAGFCLVDAAGNSLPDRVLSTSLGQEQFGRCMECRGWYLRGRDAGRLPLARVLATAGADRARALGAARAAESGLVLESPTSTVRTPYAVVAGRAGDRAQTPHDVIIALDFSDSTLEFSGVDLDGDGSEGSSPELLRRVARVYGEDSVDVRRFRQIDFDDSVLVAELLAARAIAERLDESNSKIGLVVFSDDAQLLVGLDDDAEKVIEEIDDIAREFSDRLGATNFSAAIRTSVRELARQASEGAYRRRSILLLSDGTPTEPTKYGPEDAALAAAEEAACHGIRIEPFALGDAAARGLSVYQEIAARTGGTVTRLGTPSDVALVLHQLSLTGLQGVEISNLDTGESADGLRTSFTGHFDGFLRLKKGANTIEVVASLKDGTVLRERRTVFYQPPLALDKNAREEREALQEALRVRRLRLEYWAEMDRIRQRRKSVEIRRESVEERNEALGSPE